MKTDDICERYSDQKSNLSLRLLREENDLGATVLIEGPARALRFLAELLVAVADEKENDGDGIHPKGAGSFHFARNSEMGVYIHRLDE